MKIKTKFELGIITKKCTAKRKMLKFCILWKHLLLEKKKIQDI